MKELWLSLLFAVVCCGSGCGKAGPSAAAGARSAAPMMQVVAVEARSEPVIEGLSLVGSVTANEQVELKSEMDGIVEKIHFVEGQQVEQGQSLVQLEEEKLALAVSEAEANYQLSQATHERSQQLLKDHLISQQEYDQAAATFAFNRATLDLRRRQLKEARIVAPFKGIVGARNVSPGQVISKNTTLTWVVNFDPVKVEFSVPERFLGQLRTGQEIEIGVASYPSKRFAGKVYFVAPYVDMATRTALVKAEIPNADLKLKPGMFANLDLTLQLRQNATVIPESALNRVLENNQANIFIVDSNQTAQLRPIEVGVRLAGRVEVLKGIAPGEKVIVEGLQKIGPGMKVSLAPAEARRPYEPQAVRAPADGTRL
jgi:membrane fusion protein (multidrug efflux system)